MWGFTITCARLGVRLEIWQQFMIEPASTWHQNVTAEAPYIYHYTFGLEYTADGSPMVGQAGECARPLGAGRLAPFPEGRGGGAHGVPAIPQGPWISASTPTGTCRRL